MWKSLQNDSLCSVGTGTALAVAEQAPMATSQPVRCLARRDGGATPRQAACESGRWGTKNACWGSHEPLLWLQGCSWLANPGLSRGRLPACFQLVYTPELTLPAGKPPCVRCLPGDLWLSLLPSGAVRSKSQGLVIWVQREYRQKIFPKSRPYPLGRISLVLSLQI